MNSNALPKHLTLELMPAVGGGWTGGWEVGPGKEPAGG